jgi:hypothetical protein
VSGLTTNTIIGNPLCYPDTVKRFEYDTTDAGRWLGWDFNRPDVFKSTRRHRVPQLFQGRLLVFMLDDMEQWRIDEERPMDAHIMHIDRAMCLDSPPLADLTEKGLLLQTTHAEAYARAGLGDQVPELESRNVAEDVAYQVTPRANGLIFLIRDGGNAKPHDEPHKFSILDHAALRPTPTS